MEARLTESEKPALSAAQRPLLSRRFLKVLRLWAVLTTSAIGFSLITFAQSSSNSCDLNGDGIVTVLDVQLAVNMDLGLISCTANIDGAGVCNVVVVQRVINAALGGTCVTPPLPVISSFTATPSSITSGESATLSWTTAGATNVSISPAVGTVAASGSTSVAPTQTTTYTLTATNSAGTVTQTVIVTLATTGAGYCTSSSVPSQFQSMCGNLQTYIASFASNPGMTWTKSYPNPNVLFTTDLPSANGNAGPVLSSSTHLPAVLTQWQGFQALGAKAVMVQVGFPMFYWPFFQSQGYTDTQFQAYTAFYQNLANYIHGLGMKLIVENTCLLLGDGWDSSQGLTKYYPTLDWDQYMAGRAATAAAIVQNMQPDYLVVIEEPDTEALNSGQSNANTVSGSTQLLGQIISSVQSLGGSRPPIGAGAGTWMTGGGGTPTTLQLINAYIATPGVGFIDMHIYPLYVSTFIANAFDVASAAATAHLPVSMSETWPNKMDSTTQTNWPYNSAINSFSFWEPVDQSYVQAVTQFANSVNMRFVSMSNPNFFRNYLPWLVTGGELSADANYFLQGNYAQVNSDETSQAASAIAAAQYTPTGGSYYSAAVYPADTTPPSAPTGLAAAPGYTSVFLTWSFPSSPPDNVGVVAYNLYRNGVLVATVNQATSESGPVQYYYQDQGLTDKTAYTYAVYAVDYAGNVSAPAQTTATTY